MTKNKNPSPMSELPGARVKPRIIKLNWLWFCLSKDRLGGLGFTPWEAYTEWVNRNAPKAIKPGACA